MRKPFLKILLFIYRNRVTVHSVTSNKHKSIKITCGDGIYALLNHFLTYRAVNAQYWVNSNVTVTTGSSHHAGAHDSGTRNGSAPSKVILFLFAVIAVFQTYQNADSRSYQEFRKNNGWIPDLKIKMSDKINGKCNEINCQATEKTVEKGVPFPFFLYHFLLLLFQDFRLNRKLINFGRLQQIIDGYMKQVTHRRQLIRIRDSLTGIT